MAGTEPLAIIGIGCRFPGAQEPDAFWEMLLAGRQAVAEVPPDRWDAESFYDPDPDVPGRMVSRWGGFIHGVDQFDPSFFRIAARDAGWLDPHQRLLLEVAWEALENAGQAPDRLAGSATGVFLGVSGDDGWQRRQPSPSGLSADVAAGLGHGFAANRISHFFGFTGPSMAVDTACSSALVALQRQAIPAHLHLERLDPAVNLEATCLAIPIHPVPWPRGDQPRVAGVSAFGLGGTNAHVVLKVNIALTDAERAFVMFGQPDDQEPCGGCDCSAPVVDEGEALGTVPDDFSLESSSSGHLLGFRRQTP